MARIVLENGNWFEEDLATRYEEKKVVKPDAEGVEYHSDLYHTQKGNWVLNKWNQKKGEVSDDTYHEIDTEDAAAWLAQNGYEADEIPEEAFNPDDEV